MEVPIAGVHRVCGEQPLDLRECFRRLVVAMQQHRTRVAGRLESGREFQTTVEQVSCRAVLPAAHRDLGQHADRRHVCRHLPQVVFQQPFGAWHVVGQHRCGRLSQRWVVRSALDVPVVRSVGVRRLTDRHQVIGEHAPGLGVGRLKAQQFPQRLDGRLAPAAHREGQRMFVSRRGPVRLRLQQGLKQGERRSGIAPATPRSGLQQPRRWVARMHGEDLASLLERERGILVEQAQGLRHRDLEGAGGCRGVAHPRILTETGRARRGPRGGAGRPRGGAGRRSRARCWSPARRPCGGP